MLCPNSSKLSRFIPTQKEMVFQDPLTKCFKRIKKGKISLLKYKGKKKKKSSSLHSEIDTILEKKRHPKATLHGRWFKYIKTKSSRIEKIC